MFRSGSVHYIILLINISVGPSIETIQQKTINKNLKPLKLPISNGSDVDSCSFEVPFFRAYFWGGSLNCSFFWEVEIHRNSQSSDLYPGLCWFGYSSFWIGSLGGKGETRRLVSGRTSSFNKDVILEFGGREGWMNITTSKGGEVVDLVSFFFFLQWAGTHMTLVLNAKGLLLEGSNS